MRRCPRSVLLLTLAALSAAPVQAQEVLTEDAKLVGSEADPASTVGWSVSAAEGLVVVGAWRDDEFGALAGAAYVFGEGAGGWAEEAKLVASDAAAGDTFGFAVAAGSESGSDVVVGAPGTSSDPRSDAAYVFRRGEEGAWAEEAKLTPSDGEETNDQFGRAVAVADSLALITAYGVVNPNGTTGAAYAFRRTTEGGWVEEARLTTTEGTAFNGFGRSVAVTPADGAGRPATALIGAHVDESQMGAAYAFRRAPDGTWVEEAKLTAPDGEPFDLFGLGVSLAVTATGDLLALVGSLGDDGAGEQTGAAYVFRREPSAAPGADGTWAFEAKLTAADGQIGQRLGWAVALASAEESDADAVAVLGADGAYGFAGTVRLFRRDLASGAAGGEPVWTEAAELWASDRAPGMELGYSVGVSGTFAVAGAPYADPMGGAAYVWDLRRALPSEAPPLAGGREVELSAWPNPARGAATVALRLAASAHVRLVVYDGLGRAVGVLYEGPAAAGETLVRLDAGEWAPGVYFLRLEAEDAVVTVPVTVLD